MLTGWYAGPKADRVASLTDAELVEMGLASLAEIFDLPADRLAAGPRRLAGDQLGHDPFARGAYSYATPQTRAAQLALKKRTAGRYFRRRGPLCRPDMGTVEPPSPAGGNRAGDPGRGTGGYRTLSGMPQPFHFLHEFQAQLRRFVAGAANWPCWGTRFATYERPVPTTAFLCGLRLFEQRLEALANLVLSRAQGLRMAGAGDCRRPRTGSPCAGPCPNRSMFARHR